MKKFLFVILLLPTLCFAQSADSDVQLYNDVKQSFGNGFYPGAVSAADRLLKEYPKSTFIPAALADKGESLIYLENYDEAAETLETAVAHMHSGSPDIVRCNYLLGRAYYELEKFPDSIEKFHLACKLALTNEDMNYYAPSVFYSARVFYELEKYEEAVKPFEYVVTNGKKFDSPEYGEAAQKLFICYNKTGKPSKTEALYKKFSEADFEPAVYMALSFYYADACSALGKNDEAYAAYKRVLESEDNSLAVAGDLWLRLAIQEFDNKEYDKAETYLSFIDIQDSVDNSDLKLFKNLYEAKLFLEHGNPKEAEKKLSGLESVAKKSKTEGAADSYYSTLLQCKIQNEKWEEIA